MFMQCRAWIFTAVVCLCTSLTENKKLTKNEVDTLIETVEMVREHDLSKITKNQYLITDVKTRTIDTLVGLELAKAEKEKKCIIKEDTIKDAFIQETLLEIIDDVRRKDLPLDKNILIGFINHFQFDVNTPDVITLSENCYDIVNQSSFVVENCNLSKNKSHADIVEPAFAANELFLSFEKTYQLAQFHSALKGNIEKKTLVKEDLLLLMKQDEYPEDVIEARDRVRSAVKTGNITIKEHKGWTTPQDQLLAVLTRLTTVPNNHHFAPDIHVLFAHFRMKYLSTHGYAFVPKTLPDFAFLLNSFLTIRPMEVIKALYFEFSRPDFPILQVFPELDYFAYSSPRALFYDILREMLKHPDGLKLCNTVLMNLFINEDNDETPDWLLHMFPDCGEPEPLNVTTRLKNDCEVVEIKSPCGNEKPVIIIDPECLVEIIESKTHIAFILNVLRYNPQPPDKYPYLTREAAFKAILDDLKNTKYTDSISHYVITQAIERLDLNANGDLPLIFKQICPKELKALESLSDQAGKTQTISTTARPLLLPTTTTAQPLLQPTTTTGSCTKTVIINGEDLLRTATSSIPTNLRYSVLREVIYFNDHKGVTKKEILLRVISQRLPYLTDLEIKQLSDDLKISHEGSNMPVPLEICADEENSYIVNEPHHRTHDSSFNCTMKKTVNPISLIEILEPSPGFDILQGYVLSEVILASELQVKPTRKEAVTLILKKQMLKQMSWQNMFNLKIVSHSMQVNSKENLEPEYIEQCPCSANKARKGIIEPSSLLDILKTENELITAILTAKLIIADDYPSHLSKGNILKLILYGYQKATHTEIELKEMLSRLAGLTFNEKGGWLPETTEECIDSVDEPVNTKLCPNMQIPVNYVDSKCIADIINNDSIISQKIIDTPILAMEKPYGTRLEILQAILSHMNMQMPTTNDLGRLEPNTSTCCVNVDVIDIPLCSNRDNEATESPKDNHRITPGELFGSTLPGLNTPTEECATTPLDNEIPVPASDGYVTPTTTENTIVSSTSTEPALNCPALELKTPIVKINSLWEVLTPTAPSAPYIRQQVETYVVPVDLDKFYTKGEILRDILKNIREDVKDESVLKNLDELLEGINYDGRGLNPPLVEYICLPDNIMTEFSEEQEIICKDNEQLANIVATDSLYDALSPDTPDFPYLRKIIKTYLIPLEMDKIYTKGDILQEVLTNIADDVKDEQVLKNVETLIKNVRNHGPALEEPDTIQMCVPSLEIREAKPTETTTSTPHPIITPETTTSTPHPTITPVTTTSTPHPMITPETPTRPVTMEPPQNLLISTPQIPITPATPSTVDVVSIITSTPQAPVITTPQGIEKTTPPNLGTQAPALTTQTIFLPTTTRPPSTTHRSLPHPLPATSEDGYGYGYDYEDCDNEEDDEPQTSKGPTEIVPTPSPTPTPLPSSTTDGTLSHPSPVTSENVDCSSEEDEEHPSSGVTGIVPTPPGITKCQGNEKLTKVIRNSDLLELIPLSETIIRSTVESQLILEALFTNLNKLQCLEKLLTDIGLDHIKIEEIIKQVSVSEGDVLPSIDEICRPITLRHDDITLETTTHIPCHSPQDILDPEYLLAAIKPEALPEAPDIVKIILNSSLLKKNFPDDVNTMEITSGILDVMKQAAESKLKTFENDTKNYNAINYYLRQINLLLSNLKSDGVCLLPPRIIQKCVSHQLTCTDEDCSHVK